MSKVKRYRDIEFWAENGVVYLSNEKMAAGKDYDKLPPEEKVKIFKGLPPKVFIKRAIALGILLLNDPNTPPSEGMRLRRFLEDAQEVFREARKQGAVDDPKADDYKIRHNYLAKPQIVVPGWKPAFMKYTPEEVLLDGKGVDNDTDEQGVIVANN
ncbi:MAG: hypothetical protein KatS3mg087_0009 [Patescibacteria group bacterium]|nr:MAG: hypothetical protein KatS3mg087_0009 [Patescibacteria group bacterium]